MPAPVDRQLILVHIGVPRLMAISGRRFTATEHGLQLPVSNGYSVTVDYDRGSDTYTVRRVFTRRPRGAIVPVSTVKGERTRVHADEVGEAAYFASCFRSHDERAWVSAK